MKRKQILITGGSISTLKTIEMQINDINLVTAIAENTETAIEKFHQYYFDIVIFSNEMDVEDERKLSKIFSIQNPEIIIIRHDIKEDHLLNDQVAGALNRLQLNKKPSFSFLDDALKNTGLNIIIQ